MEKAFLWHVVPWHLEILWQSGKNLWECLQGGNSKISGLTGAIPIWKCSIVLLVGNNLDATWPPAASLRPPARDGAGRWNFPGGRGVQDQGRDL